MSYVDKQVGETRIVQLRHIIKMDLEHPETRKAFENAAFALVSPIYKPDRARKLKYLIGALVVYTEKSDFSSVLWANQEHCRETAKVLCNTIAPLLCYDCLCG